MSPDAGKPFHLISIFIIFDWELREPYVFIYLCVLMDQNLMSFEFSAVSRQELKS